MANNVGGCFAGAAVPQAKASNMLPLLSCSGLDYVPSPEGAKRKLPSCEPLRNVEGNKICNSAGILDADTLTKITGPVPSKDLGQFQIPPSSTSTHAKEEYRKNAICSMKVQHLPATCKPCTGIYIRSELTQVMGNHDRLQFKEGKHLAAVM